MIDTRSTGSVINRILEYAMRVKKELAKGMVLVLIMTGLQVLAPILIGQIIDGKLSSSISMTDIKGISLILLGYFAVGIVQSFFRYVSNMSFMDTANLIAIELRQDLFNHIQKLPQRYFDNISAGKVVSRITNDTNALKVLFQNILGQIVVSGIYIIVAFIILLFTQPWATLFLLVPLPILVLMVKFYNKYSSKYNREYRRSLSQINSDINENIKGMEVIKTSNVEEEVFEEFKIISEENFNSGVQIEWLDSFTSFNATQTLSNFNVLVILLVFGIANQKNIPGFTVGLMYVLLDYTQRIYHSTQHIIQRLREIERSLAAADHIFEIFDMEEEDTISDTHAQIYGDVEFKNVSFYYKDEDYVLKDINFKVQRGNTIALVGQTGSGKSSIINLLFRFYQEQKGEVLFDGINADEYSLNDLRSNMSIVLQEPFIYEGTLRDNITLGIEYDDEVIKDALVSVGGEKLLSTLPDGLDAPFTEGGSTLSQGEKQIITFARAIIKDPKILVLDEATSSIDSETEQFIQIGLNKLKEGRTTFVIAHRLSTIKDSNEIIVLSYGNIVERGTHEELVAQDGIYNAMLMKEQNVDR
ncbi:MAG: ABC transporter ATP-binding protein [Tissierellia bacterium]|nr:ABC transporter ATP-binding protein [Tissierellia bacterium]